MRARVMCPSLLGVYLLVAFSFAACSDSEVLSPGIDGSVQESLVEGELLATTTLTVRFPGLSGVKVEVRQPDGEAGTVGGSVLTLWNQTEEAVVEVAAGLYDLRVTKGAMHRVVDEVDCTGAACTVDDLVRTATVVLDALTGVKVEFRASDGTVGTVGGSVQTLWNQTGTVTQPVLRGIYDVRLGKGASQYVVDQVDCEEDCQLQDLIRNVTVKLGTLTGVKIELRAEDGEPETVGGSVTTLWNQSGSPVFPALPGRYDLRLGKGAMSFVLDGVDCTTDCQVGVPPDLVTAALQVQFPGLSGVKVELRASDGAPGTVGGSVQTLWNQADAVAIDVLKGVYDIRLSKGAASMVMDEVDCTQETCTAQGWVTTMTVLLADETGVKVEVRVEDGLPETVGGSVQTLWSQSGTVEIPVLQGMYDVRLTWSGEKLVVDGVSCFAPDGCLVDPWGTGSPSNPPVAVISWDPQPGLTQLFSGGASPSPSGEPLTYAWDFGDGTTETGVSVIHTFPVAGAYTVTLTVTDPAGASASAEVVVEVSNPVNSTPEVAIGEDRIAEEGEELTWTGEFADPDPDDSWKVTVDYGDGTVEQLAHEADKTFRLTHSWADDGTFTVTVTVEDDDGGVGKASTEVGVDNVAPVVDAGPDGPDRAWKGEPYEFSGSFLDPGTGDTHTITWDFGDGSPPVTGTLTPSHTFTAAGTFTVTLTVEDDDGGRGSDQTAVQLINRLPAASFTTTELSWDTFRFDASGSSDPDGDDLTYQWTMGGVAAGGGITTEFTFPEPGTYTAALAVYDGDGGADETWTEVEVSAPPSSISVVEHAISTTSAYETTPTLGADAAGDILVYTSREVLPGGEYDWGQIWAQRLLADGSPTGSRILVSDGTTDDKLNDISGNLIAYTAFESKSSMLGHVMVFDVETGTRTVVTSQLETVHEARIFGTAVVWTQGQSGSMKIMYFDLNWSGVEPVIIGGPNPPASNVDIGERFVVWEEEVLDASGTFYQGDIIAYDLWSGVPIMVSCDGNRDEKSPATFGNYIVWESTDLSGQESIEMADMSDTAYPVFTTLTSGSAAVAYPSIDGDLVAYEGNEAGNFDIYLYRISDGQTFQVTTDAGDQYLNNVYGDKVAWVTAGAGSTDIFVGAFSIWP